MLQPPAESILLSSLDERWKKYRSQYKTCRIEFSEEAVHDLRASARRLLAILDIARELAPHPRVQKARHVLKDLIEDLNELRDVQVMLVEVTENIHALPELKAFQKFLSKREAKLLRSAYKKVKQKGLSELSGRMKKIRESLEIEVQKKELLSQRLLEIMNNVYLWTNQLYGQVEAAQVPTIHRFRLAFKKFRYLAEITHPLLKSYPIENMERLHVYQGRMGDIQDAQMLLVTFKEYLSEHSPKLKGEAIVRSYTKKLDLLMTEFFENKDEFISFWKITPTLQKESMNETVHHTPRNRRGGRRPQIRAGQPETTQPQGKGKDEKDRAGTVGVGNSTGPDLEQPNPADDGNSKDPGK